MNKISRYGLFLLVAIASFFLFGTNVYAEGENDATPKIRFTTAVSDWKDNNDLTFTCGSADVGNNETLAPHIYYGLYNGSSITGDLMEIQACEFTLSSLGWTENQSYLIIEEFDFTDYQGQNPEFEYVSVTPGKITSNVFESDAAIFADYNPSNSETAILYLINHTDDQGVITGGLYVYNASIDVGGEKEAEKYFGVIYIPTYCVRLSFSARGNIASPYGTFIYDPLGYSDDRVTSRVTGGDVEPVTICQLNNKPIGLGDILDIIDTDPESGDVAYTEVNHDDEYEFYFIDNDETMEGTTIYRDVEIVAFLESDLSQTGLGYRLIPFIVLIGLMVSGYIVIRKNRIKGQ